MPKGIKGFQKGNKIFFTPEHRKKLSEAAKSRKYSLETRKKMSEIAKKRIFSPETRKKLSLAFKGRIPWNKGKHSPKNPSFDNKKCFLCGWDKTYCDRHRIKTGAEGGRYVTGNVLIVCPNCHRLIHSGKMVIK